MRLVGHAHFACVHRPRILQSSSRRSFVVPHHFCPNVHLAPIVDSRFLRASWLPIPSLSSPALETTTLAAHQETKRWFFQHQTLKMVHRPIRYPIAGSNGPCVAYSSQFLNDHHAHHIANAGFATNAQRFHAPLSSLSGVTPSSLRSGTRLGSIAVGRNAAACCVMLLQVLLSASWLTPFPAQARSRMGVKRQRQNHNHCAKTTVDPKVREATLEQIQSIASILLTCSSDNALSDNGETQLCNTDERATTVQD